MARRKEKLGKILLKLSLISKDELKQVLSAQQIFGGRLGTNTVNLNMLTVDQVSSALAIQKGVPEATQELFLQTSPRALNSLAPEICAKYRIFPLHIQGRVLHLAMRDPDSLIVVDEVSFAIGMRIRPYVAPELRLAYYLERHYEIPRERHLQAYIDVSGSEQAPAGTGREARPTSPGRPGLPRRPSAQGWPVMPTPIEDVPDAPLSRVRRSTGRAPTRGRPHRSTGVGHVPPSGPAAAQPGRPRQLPTGPQPAQAQAGRGEGPSAPVTISLDDYQVEPEVLAPPQAQAPAPRAPARQPQAPAPQANSPLPPPEYVEGRVIRPRPGQGAPQHQQPAAGAAFQQPPTSEWEQTSKGLAWPGDGDDPILDSAAAPEPEAPVDQSSSSLEFELSYSDETDAAFNNRGPASFHLQNDVAGSELDLDSNPPEEQAGKFANAHTPIGFAEHSGVDDFSATDMPIKPGINVEVALDEEELTPDSYYSDLAAASLSAIKGRFDPILDFLDVADDKKLVLTSLVEPFLDYTILIMVFIPGKDSVNALAASGSDVEDETIRGMSFSREDSPTFRRALTEKVVTCGRAEDDPVQEMIASHLQTEVPTEVLVAPVTMGDRVVSLLCVHAKPGRSFDALARGLYGRLARQAALAFARLIKSSKP